MLCYDSTKRSELVERVEEELTDNGIPYTVAYVKDQTEPRLAIGLDWFIGQEIIDRIDEIGRAVRAGKRRPGRTRRRPRRVRLEDLNPTERAQLHARAEEFAERARQHNEQRSIDTSIASLEALANRHTAL